MICDTCGEDKPSVTEETTANGETVQVCDGCRLDTTAPVG